MRRVERKRNKALGRNLVKEINVKALEAHSRAKRMLTVLTTYSDSDVFKPYITDLEQGMVEIEDASECRNKQDLITGFMSGISTITDVMERLTELHAKNAEKVEK